MQRVSAVMEYWSEEVPECWSNGVLEYWEIPNSKHQMANKTRISSTK
jgi:hypothetical protein